MSATGNAVAIGFLVVLGLIVFIVLSAFGVFTTQVTSQQPNPIDWSWVLTVFLIIIVVSFLLAGIRIVRQTHRAVIETFGKYKRFQDSGITWIIPIVQKLYSLNVTEQLVNVERQGVITFDNMNAIVDAQVYYKISSDPKELQKAFYNVNNVNEQIVQLAKTTLRNVIGQKPFREVNSKRSEINEAIFESLKTQTADWGVNIVRVEVKEITPPEDVQDTMNAVIKAENTRDAEKDLALANKIKAEGDKNARIQRAIGLKTEKILQAQGEAEAIIMVATAEAEKIKLVNTSAQAYFRKEAIILEHLRVTESALQHNVKYVITEKGITPTIVLNESDRKIIPTPTSYERTSDDEERLRKDLESEYPSKRRKKMCGSTKTIDPEVISKMFATS